MILKIILLKLLQHLPGAIELIGYVVDSWLKTGAMPQYKTL